MSLENRLRRLKFRAWHRGTREADYMIGCFFDTRHAAWDDTEIAWFERLLDEEDVDIMGWALGTLAIPDEHRCAEMDAFRQLDFVQIPR